MSYFTFRKDEAGILHKRREESQKSLKWFIGLTTFFLLIYFFLVTPASLLSGLVKAISLTIFVIIEVFLYFFFAKKMSKRLTTREKLLLNLYEAITELQEYIQNRKPNTLKLAKKKLTKASLVIANLEGYAHGFKQEKLLVETLSNLEQVIDTNLVIKLDIANSNDVLEPVNNLLKEIFTLIYAEEFSKLTDLIKPLVETLPNSSFKIEPLIIQIRSSSLLSIIVVLGGLVISDIIVWQLFSRNSQPYNHFIGIPGIFAIIFAISKAYKMVYKPTHIENK